MFVQKFLVIGTSFLIEISFVLNRKKIEIIYGVFFKGILQNLLHEKDDERYTAKELLDESYFHRIPVVLETPLFEEEERL